MMKKTLSLLMAAALITGSAVCTHAADKDVSVFVDSRTVYFEDQAPVIEDSRTLVPLRGVLEAMNARVEWNEENRTVTINSYDNRTRLILTIDSPKIRKLNFITVTDTDISEVEADVAPKIINDRTMIPLRVISENMDADVDWNPENYTVTIKTKQLKKAIAKITSEGESEADAIKENTVEMTLAADKTEVLPGDTVTLTVSLANTKAADGASLMGGSTAVLYDSDKFTYTGRTTFVNGEPVDAYIGAENPDFKNDSVKSIFLFNPEETYPFEDGAFVQFTFVANEAGNGEFALADRITNVGHDTYVSITKDNKNISLRSADELTIDTAPVTVSVAEAEE